MRGIRVVLASTFLIVSLSTATGQQTSDTHAKAEASDASK